MSDAQAIPAIKRESGERFDVIVAALTAVATSVSFILAILTPPKKGRFCAPGCVEYPYTDIAAYIPRDFLWMYPALFPAPLARLRSTWLTYWRDHRALCVLIGAWVITTVAVPTLMATKVPPCAPVSINV